MPPTNENTDILTDPEQSLKFLAHLLSGERSNLEADRLLLEIKDLIEREFYENIVNDVSPRSAQALQELKETYNDLEKICFFPAMENKHVVAVGGQFSVGKSKFLNMIFKTRDLLPNKQTATTAIPTYLMKSKIDSIKTINSFHHVAEISQDQLKSIAHQFSSKYKLSFSHLLKLITIELKDFPFENIMFLDTPGYSKSDISETKTKHADLSIAHEHLRNTDLLIWLIDVKNGTISSEDIIFLKALSISQPILFILNKADMIPPKRRQEVLSEIRVALDNSDLPIYDIILYSSQDDSQFGDEQKVISSYLTQINRVKPGTNITLRFTNIVKSFLSYHQSQREYERRTKKLLTDISVGESQNESNRESVLALLTRTMNNIKSLISSQRHIKVFGEQLGQKVVEVLEKQGVTVMPLDRIALTSKGQRGNKKSPEFEATIHPNSATDNSFGDDSRALNGKVTKIKAGSVWIIIGQSLPVEVSFREVRQKGYEPKEVFTCDMPVSVRRTSRHRGYVKIVSSKKSKN